MPLHVQSCMPCQKHPQFERNAFCFNHCAPLKAADNACSVLLSELYQSENKLVLTWSNNKYAK